MVELESNIIDFEKIKKKKKEEETKNQKNAGSESEEFYFKELREKMRKETGYYE